MRLDSPFWSESQQIKKLFDALDGRLRFVGGCIRDTLLNMPVNDLDMATPFPVEIVQSKLNRAGFKTVPTGIAYGTLTVLLEPPYEKAEITTLRCDTRTDGRHAEVSFNGIGWEQDALRRDFTINALYADFDGNIFDYTHGLTDLATGTLRFIGNPERRITEDYLRLLRFFRFYARFGKNTPDTATKNACILLKEHLTSLSGERIRAEMMKLLLSPHALRSLKLMYEWGVFSVLFDFVPRFDVLERLTENRSAWLSLAALLPDHYDTYRITDRYKISKQKSTLFQVINEQIPPLEMMNRNQLFRLLHCVSRETASLKLRLQAARQNRNDLLPVLFEEMKHIPDPYFPVTGGILKRAYSLQGSAIGQAMKAGEEYWLAHDGKPDEKDIIAYLKTKKLI